MSVPEFAIPLTLDDLTEVGAVGQFCVSDNLTLGELQERIAEAKTVVIENGAYFVVDHFSTFFSFLKKFKQISEPLRMKGLDILRTALGKLTATLSVMFEEEGTLDPEAQQNTCNIVKMLCYLLVEVTNKFQDRATEPSVGEGSTKGRKKQKSLDDGPDWNEIKHNILIDIFNFWQLPIKVLWNPPVVDEEFVNLFANLCYKMLEDSSITGAQMKPMRSTIFQILYTLIANHLHGLSFCVKVVQLLRMNEHLVNPLAQGVVELDNAGCHSIVREIVREVGEADEQLLSDSAGARCISQFLVAVTESAPAAAVPAVEMLVTMMDRDPPALRCCVVTVLGEVVLSTLTKEDLDSALKTTRNAHLDMLEDHIHDINAFVRSKVLQVWQKLCLGKAIPIARVNGLLEMAVGRLNDKSTLVKKQAVQLIKIFLEGNPYSGQLDIKEISTLLADERKKLETLRKKHNLDMGRSDDDWARIETKLKKALQASEDVEAPAGEEPPTINEALKNIGDLLETGDFAGAVTCLNKMRNDFYEQLECENADDNDASLQVFRKIWEQREVPREVPEVSADILERKETLEKVVDYFEGALEFAKLIDRALPLIRTFLDSPVLTDLLEAISFFTAAYQFRFPGALDGVRRMLELVYSTEQGVKTAVCDAYKQLYFNSEANARTRAVRAVKSLSELVLKLDVCRMSALEEVVKNWVQTDVIDKTFIQVLFERFSMKISGTTEAESWAALVIISMIGGEQSKIIRSNISVLVNEGFIQRGRKNLILAEFTCKALQKLPEEAAVSAADEIFPALKALLRDGIWSEDPHYVRFADEAIMLIFMFAERADSMIEKLVVELFTRIKEGRRPAVRQKKGKTLRKNYNDEGDLINNDRSDGEEDKENNEEEENEQAAETEVEAETPVEPKPEDAILRLTRFLSLLGTISAHYINFLECRVLGELKRRNAVEFERKLQRSFSNKEMEIEKEDVEFQRTAADDQHAIEMKNITETQVVKGNGLLAKFLPLILSICKQPGKFPNLPLQNAALLALGMFMQLSSEVCEEHVQLLMTITEKSQNVEKRRNGLLLMWALQYRFPNILEPWTGHMFSMLRDSDVTVRRTAVIVLTNLIVNEMVKARSHLGDLAVCVVDENSEIAQATRHFFREYAQKGAALFNVLPSLPAQLTEPPNSLNEEQFQKVMKFVLNLVTKDKQQELLVEKLCQYFECTTSDRQCRDLAYCLSLLQFSERSLRKVLENFRCFGSKLYIAEVYTTFSDALTQATRNPQKDKALLEELTELVNEYRAKSCEDRNIPVTLRKKVPPPSTRKKVPRRKLMSSDSENDDDEEEERRPSTRTKGRQIPRRKLLSESEHEEEVFVPKKTVPASARKRQVSRKVSSESEEESVPKVLRSTRKPATAKKPLARSKNSDDSVSDEEPRRPSRGTTRKKR